MMKNINQMEVTVQKDRNFLYKFGYPVLLISLLNFNNLAQAHPYNSVDKTMTKTEVLSGDFLSQLDSKLGVKLPQGYDVKVRNMLEANVVLKNEYNRQFTQDFIIREMKKDRGISKQNQLLFIRSAIYLGMENKELYDGEDGDEKRLNEFEIAVDFFEKCGDSYMEGLKQYIKQTTDNLRQNTDNLRQNTDNLRQNTDNLRQNTDNLRQNTDNLRQNTQQTINQIMSADSVGLKEMIEIYNLYKKNPNSMKPEELSKAKKAAEHIISDCKKYGIDYKKLLPAEVRKFYGID